MQVYTLKSTSRQGLIILFTLQPTESAGIGVAVKCQNWMVHRVRPAHAVAE
jgi:hypothetical protein